MRIAVVGAGYWGSKHVRVLCGLADVEQVVVVDQAEERLLQLKRAFPSLVLHTSLEAALDEVDGCVIATPPRTHAGLANAVIAAGRGVLVEKPMTASADEAAALVEAASARSVTLMVGHTFEHNAAVRKLRDLVRNDDLGRIMYLDSARLNLGLYQPDVNVIWDLAPHDISIFNYVLGAQPDMVEAWGANHAHERLEDVAYLRLTYERMGITANIHVSWLDPCKVRRVTVVGSRRMVVYNDLASEERIRIFDKGVALPPAEGPQIPMSYRYGEITSPYLPFEEPLAVQDREFVECLQGLSTPSTDGDNGLAVVRVLEAADRSLRSGSPVRLDEVSAPAAVAPAELLVS